MLEEHSSIKKVEITQIRRQEDEDLKAIARDFSKGNMVAGLNKLDEKGLIKEHGKDYIRQGVKRFMELTDNGRDIDNTLIVTGTNKEVDLINREVRYKRYKSGTLAKDNEIAKQIYKSNNWTDAEKKNISKYKTGDVINFTQKDGTNEKNTTAKVLEIDRENNYLKLDNNNRLYIKKSVEAFDTGKEREIKIAIGDQLRVTANDREKNLINGDITKVVEIDRKSNQIITDKGQKIDIDKWKYINYGYADTSYKAQGKGKDNVLNISRRSGREQSYVDYTRTKKTYECYTSDKEKYFKSVQNAKNREAVHDLINKSKHRDIQKQEITGRKKEQAERKCSVEKQRSIKENFIKEVSKKNYYQIKNSIKNKEYEINKTQKEHAKEIDVQHKNNSCNRKLSPQKHIQNTKQYKKRHRQQETKQKEIEKTKDMGKSRGFGIGY